MTSVEKRIAARVDALKDLEELVRQLSEEFALSIVKAFPQAHALQEALNELERLFPGIFKAIKTGQVKVRVVEGALEVIHSTEYLEQLCLVRR